MQNYRVLKYTQETTLNHHVCQVHFPAGFTGSIEHFPRCEECLKHGKDVINCSEVASSGNGQSNHRGILGSVMTRRGVASCSQHRGPPALHSITAWFSHTQVESDSQHQMRHLLCQINNLALNYTPPQIIKKCIIYLTKCGRGKDLTS